MERVTEFPLGPVDIRPRKRQRLGWDVEKIHGKLGEGTFGQVLECWDNEKKEFVAIKFVRRIKNYRDAAMIEIDVLQQVGKHDKGGNWSLGASSSDCEVPSIQGFSNSSDSAGDTLVLVPPPIHPSVRSRWPATSTLCLSICLRQWGQNNFHNFDGLDIMMVAASKEDAVVIGQEKDNVVEGDYGIEIIQL
ncbi:hypothetical protein L2E82_12611 [Cichorium intybus]|uniref:Uncharacterized protein n=1 Tax=Cichorium intybus TaxID=13427 RepID=A0ACB9GHK7_CICIN|nr:hypothetical protein L2E82_12611 [Cichorium intybus]